MKICDFEGCGRKVSRRNLCKTHYDQRRAGEELRPIGNQGLLVCEFEGCGKPRKGQGLCAGHLEQRKKGIELQPLRERKSKPVAICDFVDCEKPVKAKGLCQGHYSQFNNGQELRPLNWRANRTCSFDNCDLQHYADGFCNGHFQQNKNTGVLKPLITRPPMRDRAALAAEIAAGVRTCIDCEQQLPLDCFSKDGSGFTTFCKSCGSDRYIKRMYGVSRESWEAYLESQGNCCAICKTDDPGHSNGWATDHDHSCCPGEKTCGRCVRAILCQRCNASVGFIETHPDLEAVMRYLSATKYWLSEADEASAAEFYGWNNRHLHSVKRDVA